MTMFFFVFKRLLRHPLITDHIMLVDDFAVQGRLAIHNGDNQENTDGYQMRQRFFQEGRIHKYRSDYSRQNNGILPINTDF
jgi:hypothetical protein